MEIVPFHPRHLLDIRPTALTPAQFRRVSYRARGAAFTLLRANLAVGCGGVIVNGDTGHAWACLSDGLRARPTVLHRHVKRVLAQIEREHGLRRIYATVYDDFIRGKRWLARLGFREEETLTDYRGTGFTYRRFVR